MTSTIEHERAGMVCFVRVQLEKRIVIGYVRGTLMHANLYGCKDLDGRRGLGR